MSRRAYNNGTGVWKLTSFTDREGNTTTDGHDSNNRIVRITDAVMVCSAPSTSGDVISTVYDDVGNAVQQCVDPSGPGTGGGAATTFYTYDGVGNLTTLATTLNGGGAANSVTYTYDDRNLIDTVSVPDTTDVIDLDHDPAGFRTTTTYPGGVSIDATKDSLDRLDTLVATDGTTAWLNVDHTYSDGQLTEVDDSTAKTTWFFDYDQPRPAR